MTFKVSAMMFAVWGILAVITALVELDSVANVPGAPQAFNNLSNEVGTPNEVNVDAGQIGVESVPNPFTSPVTFVSYAQGWVTFMFRAVTLQSSIWDSEWLLPVRAFIIIFSLPAMFMLVKELMSISVSVITAAGGVLGGLTRAFRFP